jgi:hypothetical protein
MCIYISNSAFTASHPFDSTVVALASHAQTGLLVSGDTSGTLCAWRWQAGTWAGAGGGYALLCTISLPSRVESVAVSPGGALLAVAVQRGLFLLAFSHTRADARPGAKTSLGSLYVRAVLDSEASWTARTAYHCAFLQSDYSARGGAGQAGSNENLISVWKVAVEDGAPSELVVSHWLHPNVEHSKYDHRCPFR